MSHLREIFTRLHAAFGPLHGAGAAVPWWPLFGDDRAFEILVGAVLVQQTRWESVEAAIARLIAADLLRPAAIASADAEALAGLLRPCAFYRQKAKGLIAIAQQIVADYQGETAALLSGPRDARRAALLALPRFGRETTDVVLLYAAGHAVFVIDDYTRRLCGRVEAGHDDDRFWRRGTYEALRARFEGELGHDAAQFAEYHAQINEACVRYCLSRPRCAGPPARRVYSRQPGREAFLQRDEGCPLRPICAFYQQQQSASQASADLGSDSQSPAPSQ